MIASDSPSKAISSWLLLEPCLSLMHIRYLLQSKCLVQSGSKWRNNLYHDLNPAICIHTR